MIPLLLLHPVLMFCLWSGVGLVGWTTMDEIPVLFD